LGQDRPAPLRAVERSSSRDWQVFSDVGPAESHAARSGAESKPRLSVAERSAFREIARALGARFAGDDPPEILEEPRRSAEIVPAPRPQGASPDPIRVLDQLPVGVLVHRGERPIFANRVLLDWLGYGDVEALAADGGVARLFRGWPHEPDRSEEGASPLTVSTRHGRKLAVEARLTAVEWGDAPAGLMLIRKLPEADPAHCVQALELELEAREARVQELSAILDTATDGVLVLDTAGRILALNRSAEALFGYDQKEVAGEPITVLLAPESHAAALEYLNGLQANGVASLLNDGREVIGRARQGGAIPLFMTMGRVSDGPERKMSAVLRDITAYKKAEGELHAAKHAAEEVNAQRSDLLARINHEIRTPLNAVIGFAEMMLEERFGPMGNERYKDYLKDIHASGRRIMNLVDNLLDLAKIEAGRVELSFTAVNLNALVASCMTLMQPQAARERIVMRTSFAQRQVSIMADEHSMRQIVLNIVSNAIQFTDAGGQVIVSTAVTDRGEVALRVRDTGIGMAEGEIEAALKPFGQIGTARRGDGMGLGLPLTKALVAANRGALQIVSVPNEGTLVEILFPPTRVPAE
jgi:PAS domain S-box-containing protein